MTSYKQIRTDLLFGDIGTFPYAIKARRRPPHTSCSISHPSLHPHTEIDYIQLLHIKFWSLPNTLLYTNFHSKQNHHTLPSKKYEICVKSVVINSPEWVVAPATALAISDFEGNLGCCLLLIWLSLFRDKSSYRLTFSTSELSRNFAPRRHVADG